MRQHFLWFLLLVGVACTSAAQKMVTFNAADGLAVTADIYETHPDNPWILLCHQASFSRGEYRETAPRLNALGFNCLAIDQRSGKGVNGVSNATAQRANEQGLPTKYTHAEPDILAAIAFLAEKSGRPIILVGSSYSAALVLKIARDHEQVRAVAAFSPGEYIRGQNIRKAAAGTQKPVFVTSSKNEASDVASLVQDIDTQYLTHFVPESAGKHGSKALWKKHDRSGEYWKAFAAFLEPLK
ncbi:MAG: alpha/beta hydrolase [Bacteroidota bacterium]